MTLIEDTLMLWDEYCLIRLLVQYRGRAVPLVFGLYWREIWRVIQLTISTRPRMAFEDYLTYDDGTDNRYQWIDGVLLEMPTESEFNAWLSLALQLLFHPFKTC